MLFGISKTTVAGILSGLMGLSGPASVLLASLQKINSTQPGAAAADYTLAIWGIVLTFIFAVLRIWVGLLQGDAPPNPPSGPPTASAPAVKVGALMLCVVLISGLFSSGCSGVTVAQDIVNWTPALQSAVATVDTAASLLAPADAPIFAAATVGFDALSNQIVAQAKAYLANPTATLLQQLQAQVITFQQSVNAGLLKLAGIKDAASQQHALAALNGVATIINTIFGLVAGIKGNTVAAAATAKTVSLNAVMPYLDRKQAAALLAAHYRESNAQAYAQLDAGQQLLAQAGF